MMKNTLYIFTLPVLILVFTSCTTAKAEKSTKDIPDAQIEKEQVNRQYDKEVENYRLSMEKDLRNNNLRIARLKDEKLDLPEKAIQERSVKIETLQKRNDALELRINTYKGDQEEWKEFKREFNSDMKELEKSLKGFPK